MPFELASDYSPQGDQAQAIAKLSKSLLAGHRRQTLLGVADSGQGVRLLPASPLSARPGSASVLA